MAENKTKPTQISVSEFVKSSDPKKVEDSFALIALMEKISGEKAIMWGPSIIGFGNYHYKYESGREGDICKVGFSPRKSAFSLYVIQENSEKIRNLVKQLGKIKMGQGSCIYFKKLADLDLVVLEELILYTFEKNVRKK